MVVAGCCSFHTPCIQGVLLSIWGRSGNRCIYGPYRTPAILCERPNSICREYCFHHESSAFAVCQHFYLLMVRIGTLTLMPGIQMTGVGGEKENLS